MQTHLPFTTTILAAVALAIGVAPAQATTAALTPDRQFLDVTESTPGETNNLVAKLVSFDGRQYVDMYDDEPIQTGAGCATSPMTGITRCVDPAQAVRIALGGGDDRFTTSEVGTSITFGGGLRVDLGAGNDIYEGRGTNAIAEVHGGDGADDLRGSQNTDHFDGGPGTDKLHGYEGPDDLHGGADDDTLTGDGPSASGIFADVLDGGPGRDRLDDYVFSGDPMNAPAISVSLDNAANDGRQGEQDAVSAIEAVKSGSAGSFTGDEAANEFVAPQTGPPGTLRGNGGDDVLIAGDANADAVDGGAGNDLVEGGFGDDRLVGGAGRDTVNGDRKSRCNEYSCDLIVAGSDTIEVRDGEVDSVTCGPGVDRVLADAADVVAADCENVERGGQAPGGDRPSARVTLKVLPVSLGKALRRGLKVRITGASGAVRLKVKRGKTIVARGTGRARGSRGEAMVTLRFTTKAKRSLRHKRRVSLRISGEGASRVVRLKRA